MTRMKLDDDSVIYDPTSTPSEHARLQAARRFYAEVHGSTVAGLARRFGIEHERMRRALVGRYGGANLVQKRIDSATDLEKRLGVRVRAEVADLEPRRVKVNRRPYPKKNDRRPRYEPLIGASVRDAVRRRWQQVREAGGLDEFKTKCHASALERWARVRAATSAAPAPAQAAPRS